MEVAELFGNMVAKLDEKDHARARRLLRLGWSAMNLKYAYAPDKRLIPAERYLAHMLMNVMLEPLKHPERCAIVSIFTPCEMLQEAGLVPYNAEAFSSYLSASNVEKGFIQVMDDAGISDTFCSYHKIFGGAALTGLIPKPACIVHTNLICDANLTSFRSLARHYGCPLFYIDVPSAQDEASVKFVERQLRELGGFLHEVTGRKVDDDSLSERLERSRLSLQAFDAAQRTKARKDVPTDLVSPLYCAMATNIMLGTPELARFVEMLLDDVMGAPPKSGLHLYWMHTLPYWSTALQKLLMFSSRAQISGDEMGQVLSADFDPSRPYEAMARRMVTISVNGPAARRIDAGVRNAKAMEADGVEWFNQWGCKHTIGASQLARRRFEEAGLPCLVLDGDGCDRSHGGEGQLETRMDAFLEMLEAR